MCWVRVVNRGDVSGLMHALAWHLRVQPCQATSRLRTIEHAQSSYSTSTDSTHMSSQAPAPESVRTRDERMKPPSGR